STQLATSWSSSSTTSKSLTRLSASWTNRRPSLTSRGCVVVMVVAPAISCRRSVLKSEDAGDHVASHVDQRTVVRERVGPEPGQGRLDRDAELDHQHSRGLMDLRTVRQVPGTGRIQAPVHAGRVIDGP